MVCAKSRKWDAQNSLGLWDRNGSSNLGQTTKHSNTQPKKKKEKKKKKKKKKKGRENLPNSDHRVKQKESEKRDEYLDLAREMKKIMEYESDGNTNCNWRAQYCH